MTKKHFYLTTPLYYVNAKPHIGHAYTNVLCDAFARYHRLLGESVFFLTGTDEHGTKIEKAARESEKEPKIYVDEMVPEFQKLWNLLGIRYDYFIRTTDAEHKEVVRNILRDLESKGDIYKASYTGWYCTPCESFWTGLQLEEGKCPDCRREVQELSEENYFFKLSQYQDWLIDYIQAHPDFIRPEMRKNEIMAFLREPLEDLCITRPRARLAWGIEYPTSPDHVIYVWFDALINYVSAIRYTTDADRFAAFWPVDLHLVGKDILRQHAVYWPIMLRACGLEMPKTVLAHGWWTIAGSKVSKSRGNVVDPVEIVTKYGVDAFRYFLLHEVTIGSDGAYSEDLLRERYTTDLANDLGNLWFRLASMLGKYFSGELPHEAGEREFEVSLLRDSFELWDSVRSAMLDYNPRKALDEIWKVVTQANQFIEEKKPWVLAKDEAQRGELARVMVVLTECLAHVACVLQALLPNTAVQILKRLHLPEEMVIKQLGEYARPFVKAGVKIERGEALFPRLEEAQESI